MKPNIDWNNKAEVLEAVRKSGLDLQYASDELRNDKDVVVAAIQQNGYALEYASAELKNDRQIVIKAIMNSMQVIN